MRTAKVNLEYESFNISYEYLLVEHFKALHNQIMFRCIARHIGTDILLNQNLVLA